MSVNSVTFLNFVRTAYLGTNVRSRLYREFCCEYCAVGSFQNMAEIKMYKKMRVTNFDSLKRGQNETLTF